MHLKTLAHLNEKLLDRNLLRPFLYLIERCSYRSYTFVSTFHWARRESTPRSPTGLLAAPVLINIHISRRKIILLRWFTPKVYVNVQICKNIKSNKMDENDIYFPFSHSSSSPSLTSKKLNPPLFLLLWRTAVLIYPTTVFASLTSILEDFCWKLRIGVISPPVLWGIWKFTNASFSTYLTPKVLAIIVGFYEKLSLVKLPKLGKWYYFSYRFCCMKDAKCHNKQYHRSSYYN